MSNGHDKSALFFWLWSERSVTTDCRDQWTEQRHVTSCLSSAPHPPATANGATIELHVTLWAPPIREQRETSREFKIWAVNMLSARWEHGACAAALMLRADIRQFSIVRRPVNEDIMRSSPYVAGRHSLDHVNQRHVNAIEISLITLAACALPGWRLRVAIAPWFDSFMFKLRPPSTG